MDRRIEKVRVLLQREKLDGMLITNDQNRYYISGFSGSAGALIVTAEQAILLSDFRYQDQAAREAPAWDFRLIKPLEIPEDKLVAAVASELGIGTLGFEAGHVTVARHRVLSGTLASAAPALEFRPREGLIEELRTVKDQHEIAVLERAIAITDQAFAAIRPLLRPEMRERDVAWELEKAMRLAGPTDWHSPSLSRQALTAHARMRGPAMISWEEGGPSLWISARAWTATMPT